MKQYEVPAIINGEKVKFVVSVPSKDENLTIISDEIVQIVELDFT